MKYMHSVNTSLEKNIRITVLLYVINIRNYDKKNGNTFVNKKIRSNFEPQNKNLSRRNNSVGRVTHS